MMFKYSGMLVIEFSTLTNTYWQSQTTCIIIICTASCQVLPNKHLHFIYDNKYIVKLIAKNTKICSIGL